MTILAFEIEGDVLRRVIFTAIAAVILIVSITSCTEKAPKIPELVTGFSGNANVEMGETKLQCSVSHTERGISSITVSEPEGLKGLSFKNLGGTYAISYNDLICETENSFLPDSSFAKVITNVLDKASEENGASYQKSEEDNAVFSGTSKSGDFMIYADSETGMIKKIEVPKINITAQFSDTKKL